MRKLGKGMGLVSTLVVAGAVALGAAGLALAQEPATTAPPTVQRTLAASSAAVTGSTPQTSPASTSAQSAPASSAAPSSRAAARAAAASSPATTSAVTVRLSAKDDALVVPYGVDPLAWLTNNLTFDVTVTKTDGTTQTEEGKKAADVADYFADGKVLVRASVPTGQDVPYPANRADDQGNLTKAPDWTQAVAFGTAAGDGSVTYTLPTATDLKATMSWSYKDASSLNSIPVAPEAVVSSLTQSLNGSADRTGVVVSGTYKDGDVALWLDAADLAQGAAPVILHVADGSQVRLSNDVSLKADGTFTSASAPEATDNPVTGGGTGYKADAATSVVYLRLAADVHNPDDNTKLDYTKGELVRVPVKVDTTAPEATALTVIDANGATYDLDQLKAKAQGGVVVVPAAGLKVKVSLDDPTAPAGSADTDVSGLTKTATLTVGDGDAAKRLSADIQPDGTATFTLDAAALGQGVFDVSSLHLSADDVAGNALNTTLDQVEGSLKGDAADSVTKVAIFDPAAADNADAFGIVLNGTAYTPDTATADVPVSTSLAAALRVKTNDALGLGGLLVPKSYVHTVETANAAGSATEVKTDRDDALALDGFTTGMNPYKERLLADNLGAEGLHTFTFDVTGSDRFLTAPYAGNGAAAKVAQRFLLDKTAPVATDASFSGADALSKDDISHVTGSSQDGAYVLGGARTVTVSVKDLLAGKVDAPADVSGVDWSKTTATVTRYANEYDERGTTQALAPADSSLTYDDAAGTVSLRLSDDGLYRLDHIALHLEDKAGNATGDVKLSDVVAAVTAAGSTSHNAEAWKDAEGKAVNGFIVITQATPNVNIHVNGVAGNQAEHAYQTAPKVTVVVKDPLFGIYKQGGRDLSGFLTLTGAVTPGEDGTGTKSIPALSFADFTKQPDGTWAATVTLPGTTADPSDTLEGTYGIKAQYKVPYAPANHTEDQVAFVYDKTAPSVTSAELLTTFDATKDAAKLSGTKHDGLYAVGGSRQITVSVADLLPRGTGDETDVSGLDPASLSASIRRYASVGDDKGTVTDVPADKLSFDATAKTVTITLSDGGIYPLSGITLRVQDKAGTAETYKLSDVVAATTDSGKAASWKGGGADAVDGIVVANASQQPQILVDGAVDDTSVEQPYQGDPAVYVRVSDPLFAVYQELPGFSVTDCLALSGTATPNAALSGAASINSGALSSTVAKEPTGEAWDVKVTLPAATDGAGDLEASYALNATYAPHGGAASSTATANFLVDRSAPSVTDAGVVGTVDPSEVAKMDSGSYLFGGERTFRVRLQDLLRGSAAAGEDHASGVDVSTVQVTARRRETVGSSAVEDVTLVKAGDAGLDADGYLTVKLTDAGEYDLDEINVQFSDKAGNVYNCFLSQAISDASVEDAWKFGGSEAIKGILVVDQSQLGAGRVALSVNDANDHQVVKGAWSRVDGPLSVTLTVNDANFDVWRHTALVSKKSFFSLELTPGSASVNAPVEKLAGYDVLDKMTKQSNGSWSYTFTIPATGTGDAADGSYRAEMNYGAFLGFGGTTTSITFGVDHKAPLITIASLVDAASVQPADATTGRSHDVARLDNADGTHAYYLVGGARAITITTRDLLRAYEGSTPAPTEDHASGVDWDSLKVTLAPDKDAYGSKGVSRELTLAEGGGLTRDGESVTVPLDSDGLYRLSDIRVSYADNAGNTYEDTLDKIVADRGFSAAWSFGAPQVIEGIVVDTTPLERDDLTLDVSKASDDVPDSRIEGLYRGDVKATVTVKDPWFDFWRHTDRASSLFSGSLTPAAASLDQATSDPIDLDALDFTDADKSGVWTYDAARNFPAADGHQVEGRYSLAVRFDGISVPTASLSANASFVVDHTAPAVTEANLAESVDANRDVAVMDDGSVYVVGGSRTLRVRMRDLLRGLAPTDGNQNRNQPETAGIATAEDGASPDITVTLTRRDGLNLSVAGSTTEKLNPVTIGDDGWVSVPLDDEGLYLTSDITFDAKDAAGNDTGTVSLADVIASLNEQGQAYWRFGAGTEATGIVVDDPATAPEAGVDVSDGTNDDGSAIPTSDDPYYHRGNTVVTVWAKDTWLDAYRHTGRQGTFSANQLRRAGADAAEAIDSVAFDDLSYDANSDRWYKTYDLPLAQKKDKLPVEGDYAFDVAYEGLAGTPGSLEVDPAPVTFGVDYTAPNFGTLTLSDVTPAAWGWVFSTNDERMSAQLTDNVSGMRGSTAKVAPMGTVTADDLGATYVGSGNDCAGRTVAGSLDFSFGDDAQRLYFSGTKLSVKDVAGNEATVDMGSYVGHDSNIPASWGEEYDTKPYVGVAIDKVAPTIDVTYDNNDVHNGQYYNKARTATVTITESNFGLVRANDKDRVIATVGRDGQEAGQVTAERFSNPSGDGTTWVATYTFEDDADWTLDVSFTDPANRVAESYHSAFVVDTTAPTISVQWDNTEAESGAYFKAPRTASVTVNERNFSSEFAGVTATASDASGAPAGAPGDTGWVEAKPREEYANSLHFGGELHYTMKVTVTDLAGNVAEEYNEPEFVIDMTAPQVSIGGVADHHAYADMAAPTIEFSDTNFDPGMAQYMLTGGRRGQDVYFDTTDQETSTSKDVTFADFEHTLDNDDVYTLVATVKDKAGNTAQQTATFSVNRYGSNYVMLDGSGNVLGSYINKPQDIVVAEINASGLDEAKSRAELTHDTSVSTLAAGTDYTVASDNDQWAWNETTYTFPAKLFVDDGYYRLILTSTDLAGNLSQNTMNAKNQARDGSAAIDFAKDGTEPRAELVGITSNTAYLDPNKQVNVGVQDNLAVDTAQLTVDGNGVASWSGDDLAAGDLSQALQATGLPADDQNHDVELVVTDKAGNQTRVSATSVMVTSDLVTYVFHTPALLYAVTGGFVALLTVIGVAIFLSVRHHRLTEGRRNPFGYGASKK